MKRTIKRQILYIGIVFGLVISTRGRLNNVVLAKNIESTNKSISAINEDNLKAHKQYEQMLKEAVNNPIKS